MRILLVEDDPLLGDGLAIGLAQAGFTVDWLKDGQAADHALASSEQFDVVVLDLGLPGRGGMEVLRRMRARAQTLPVLILTARDALADRVAGLDSGGDDYLIKPVALDELAARIRALLRRANGKSAPLLQVGPITLDPAQRIACVANRRVALSSREFDILHTLMLHSGSILSRTQIEQSLYGWNEALGSNAIEVHIHHLRRKLGGDLIHTVRGVGYQLRASEAAEPS